MPSLYLLWDESHLWGLLAVRAVKAMNLPHRLVRGREIAAGLLEQEPCAMLLVPGGNARHKAEALGPEGIAAVRAYVAGGGQYLGFCGGAGLALTWSGKVEGLGLCPWKRAGFDERMQHFMSGHLHMALPAAPSPLVPENFGPAPLLPVWWPGRFESFPHADITVLATYEKPGEDFWLADLPIADLPEGTFSAWQDLYGFSPTPTFLTHQPCLVHGRYGKGAYTLSYSHLETPASPEANAWLAHILRVQAGLAPACDRLPAWNLENGSAAWDDAALAEVHGWLEDVLRTGTAHGLLFCRNDWLMGWRTGIPGAGLNNLRSALYAVRAQQPSPRAEAFLRRHREKLLRAADLFHTGCVQYLLAERLAVTLAKSLPDAVPPAILKGQREALFGPPMQAGGAYRELMEPLDELAFLQMAD